MFNKAQHIEIMNTRKFSPSWLILSLAAIFLASCSTISDMPDDDVYYAKKAKNPSEYNWSDFQKNAQSYNTGKSKTADGNTTQNVTGDSFGTNSKYQGSAAGAVAVGDIATTVKSGEDTDGDYQYIDEYYDSDYESRVNRFGSNSEESGFGYYDGYNSSSGCGCNNSNWSMSFGMGVGMGMGYGMGSGWSMGYGYGWPHYGSSFSAGYSAGYYNGYMNGYYNGWGGGYYPYYPNYGYGGYGGYYPGGGYIPEYGGMTSYYGPRNYASGGTTIPRSGGGGSTVERGDGKKSSGDTYVSGRGSGRTVTTGGGTTAAVANTGTNRMSKPADQTSGNVVAATSGSSVNQGTPEKQEKINKPVKTTGRDVASASREGSRTEMKYKKPKSYQSLPSKQPRSSMEYNRSTSRTPKSNLSNSDPYMRTKKPSTGTSTFGTNRNTKSNSNTKRSYSSPTRTNTSRSYSSPSRSSYNSGSTGGGSRSSSSGTSRGGGSSSKSSGGIKR